MEAFRKIKKTITKKKRRCLINSVPQDLIVEITAALVSISPTPVDDIQRLRTTCKSFFNASMEDVVGRSMAVEKEESMSWWDHQTYLSLLHYCAVRGNAQASFLLALNEICKVQRQDIGLQHLECAAKSGSCMAEYLMGIIFFKQTTNRALGIALLNKVDINAGSLSYCRRRVAGAIRRFWMRKAAIVVAGEPMPACRNCQCGRMAKVHSSYWVEDDDIREFCSQECRWNYECVKFLECL